MAEWTPPVDPDPSVIFDEARNDTRARRYEDALAKHVWYHKYAVEHGPGLSAVRLSFALHDWFDLANEYPPAMEKLRATRDALTEQLDQGADDPFDVFHDYKSINALLEENNLTVEAFLKLDKDSPEAASVVYNVAEPALAAAGEYEICGRYLKPNSTLEHALEYHQYMHQENRRVGQDSRQTSKDNFNDFLLAERVGRLIALLVLNDRHVEAEPIASAVRKHLKMQKHLALIDTAMKGDVPSGLRP
jgi:hypothetical protein